MKRRTLLFLAGVVAAGPATACAEQGQGPQRWHDGRLALACGNTTGVFYQFGGGYADLITKYVHGYNASAEPTAGSGDNIMRVASGDMELGMSFADTASDAVTGNGAFEGRPQKIVALARVYRNYAHLAVRVASRITTFADLRGKTVSTSTLNSGTDLLAGRLLTAGGLDPDRDVKRVRLSLPETVSRMRAGTIDALFFSAGLPTPGVADLIASAAGEYALVAMGNLLPAMAARYGATYAIANIPQSVYGTPSDVDTIVVPNLVIAAPDMPDDLAYEFTKVLFEHQPELAKAHPEGLNFDRAGGPHTDPVPLHPGSRRYFTDTN
jgi:TRAP transporter TAXI family solute receptor